MPRTKQKYRKQQPKSEKRQQSSAKNKSNEKVTAEKLLNRALEAAKEEKFQREQSRELSPEEEERVKDTFLQRVYDDAESIRWQRQELKLKEKLAGVYSHDRAKTEALRKAKEEYQRDLTSEEEKRISSKAAQDFEDLLKAKSMIDDYGKLSNKLYAKGFFLSKYRQNENKSGIICSLVIKGETIEAEGKTMAEAALALLRRLIPPDENSSIESMNVHMKSLRKKYSEEQSRQASMKRKNGGENKGTKKARHAEDSETNEEEILDV